jgi:hypothetical protein
MTETIIVQEPAAPPKEYRYEYQPQENGVALGGKQVIIYDGTPEDLGAKMAAQNEELIRLNRRLKKDLRLSSSTVDQIPDNISRFDESKYDLKPEPLTAEERIQLASDINDPEKFDAVSQRLVRAQIGDPNALRARLARVEQRIDRSTVQEEAIAFKNANPDYYPHPDNLQTLAAWIQKNNLDPVKENFQFAYDQLKEFMVQKPAPAPVVQKTDEPAPTPVPAAHPVARPVSSGLTRSNGSDSGPAPSIGITRAEIDKMSGDEYKKRLLHEQGFRAKVEALDQAEAQRRQARA